MERAEAQERDRVDPLAAWRDEFVMADDVIYLDGNSLGMAPRAAIERLHDVAEREWATGLIRSWDEWFTRRTGVGDRLAPVL